MESATAMPIRFTTSPFVITKNDVPDAAIRPNDPSTVPATIRFGRIAARSDMKATSRTSVMIRPAIGLRRLASLSI